MLQELIRPRQRPRHQCGGYGGGSGDLPAHPRSLLFILVMAIRSPVTGNAQGENDMNTEMLIGSRFEAGTRRKKTSSIPRPESIKSSGQAAEASPGRSTITSHGQTAATQDYRVHCPLNVALFRQNADAIERSLSGSLEAPPTAASRSMLVITTIPGYRGLLSLL